MTKVCNFTPVLICYNLWLTMKLVYFEKNEGYDFAETLWIFYLIGVYVARTWLLIFGYKHLLCLSFSFN